MLSPGRFDAKANFGSISVGRQARMTFVASSVTDTPMVFTTQNRGKIELHGRTVKKEPLVTSPSTPVTIIGRSIEKSSSSRAETIETIISDGEVIIVMQTESLRGVGQSAHYRPSRKGND